VIQRLLAISLAVLVVAVLSVVAADLPAFGSLDAPARNETLSRYTGSVREDTGAVNSVTAVIFDYRAYDTLGEATVLFTAAAALAAMLAPSADRAHGPSRRLWGVGTDVLGSEGGARPRSGGTPHE